MPIKYNQPQQARNNILSISRNLQQSNSELKLDVKEKTNTILKQKRIIQIYVEDNKKFITKAAAYSLGFTNVRAIMVSDNSYFELSEVQLKKIQDLDIDIKYINLSKTSEKINYNQVENKAILEVFTSENYIAIRNSAAYALGLITVSQFHNSNELFPISQTLLEQLKGQYEIKYASLSKTVEDKSIKKDR